MASRFHRLLLWSYPAEFRDRYGEQLIAFWEEQARESRYQGAFGRMRLWAQLVRDAVSVRLPRSDRPSIRPDADWRLVHGDRSGGRPRGMRTRWAGVRHSMRALRRAPGFTVVAGLTLALGIGATTSVFAVVNGVLWRALPYSGGDRLVAVERINQRYASGVSWPDFRDWRDQAAVFANLAAWREDEAAFGFGDGAELLEGAAVSRDLFETLGMRPILGRTFSADEDRRGGVDAVVLSHGLWQERFGGDRAVIGRRIIVDDRPLEIVGVMERGFAFPGEAKYWRPLQDDALLQRLGLPVNSRSLAFLRVIGRLADGIDAAGAETRLTSLHARIREVAGVPEVSHRILVQPYRAHLIVEVRTTLLFLMGSAALVLLVVCANVAGLALARSGIREREYAVRSSLGASRTDLRAQALSESLLLAMGAGVAGVALSVVLTRLIVRLAPSGIPRLGEAGVDTSALAFALAATLLTALLFGWMPAMRAGRVDASRAITSGLRVAGGDRRSLRSQHVLVVGQIAVSVALLSAAGLLWRSYARLMAVEPGYVTEDVWTAWIAPPISRYDSPARVTAFYDELLARLRALPDVLGASTTYAPPLVSNGLRVSVAREGESPAEEEAPWINSVVVGNGFFDLSGIPLLEGRDFDARDHVGAPPVAIVSRATAEALWPEGAIGQRFRYTGGVGGSAESFDSLAMPRHALTVIGVAADVRRDTLSAEPPLEFYRPHAQVPWASQFLVVRTSGGTLRLAERLRDIVWAIDPAVPLRSIESLESRLRDHTAEPRLRSFLVVAFATIAAFLAMLGVYAVMAISVARRTRELGVRMALGATAAGLQRAVFGRGLLLAVAGCALGLGLALASGRVLASMLYQLEPGDPVTLAAVLGITMLAACMACWIPSLRASRTDPVRSLQRD